MSNLAALSQLIDQLAVLYDSIGHCIIVLSAYELSVKAIITTIAK